MMNFYFFYFPSSSKIVIHAVFLRDIPAENSCSSTLKIRNAISSFSNRTLNALSKTNCMTLLKFIDRVE